MMGKPQLTPAPPESLNPLIDERNIETLDNAKTVLEYLCYSENDTEDIAVTPMARLLIARVAFNAIEHVQKQL